MAYGIRYGKILLADGLTPAVGRVCFDLPDGTRDADGTGLPTHYEAALDAQGTFAVSLPLGLTYSVTERLPGVLAADAWPYTPGSDAYEDLYGKAPAPNAVYGYVSAGTGGQPGAHGPTPAGGLPAGAAVASEQVAQTAVLSTIAARLQTGGGIGASAATLLANIDDHLQTLLDAVGAVGTPGTVLYLLAQIATNTTPAH